MLLYNKERNQKMAPKISAKKSSDISRNTILILLILTIILSGISTWVILDTLDNVKQNYLSSLQSPSVSHGQIMVGILPNPDLIREIPK
jgi:hypothetical protein